MVMGQRSGPQLLFNWWGPGVLAMTIGRWPIRVYLEGVCVGHYDRSPGIQTLLSMQSSTGYTFLSGRSQSEAPPRQVVSPWDLQTVLDGLGGPLFEPLDRTEIRFLSFETALLLALSSAKRMGDLCALSVHPSCISFSQDGGLLHLWPNPAFHPKVITSDFRSRVIWNRALCAPSGTPDEDARLQLLCPVRALRCYIDRTAAFRTTNQLFVGFETNGQGAPLSSLAYWVRGGIAAAYEARGCPPPAVIRAVIWIYMVYVQMRK